MDRFTTYKNGWRVLGDGAYMDDALSIRGEAIDLLAAYEDTGLTPEQVKTAIRIAERIATADYPHNFQRERRDIVDYMNWITDVMRDAKAWWNGRMNVSVDRHEEAHNGA